MIPIFLYDDLERIFAENGEAHLLPALRFSRAIAVNHTRHILIDADPGVCSRYTADALRKEVQGKAVRTELSAATDDLAVNQAHDNAGIVREFFKQVLVFNSFDNKGADLWSSVHYGRNYSNAFFNGEYMAYGDGDGLVFLQFTQSLDVAAHEIGHGIVWATANLKYLNESGALNEHYADIFGICCKHWHLNTDIGNSNWLIGPDIVGPKFPGSAIRSFKNELSYVSDPQPKHKKDMYHGDDDEGGVHINSGIPNHAFYLFCTYLYELKLADNSWVKPLQSVWFPALQRLKVNSSFRRHKKETLLACAKNFPDGLCCLERAWTDVGM